MSKIQITGFSQFHDTEMSGDLHLPYDDVPRLVLGHDMFEYQLFDSHGFLLHRGHYQAGGTRRWRPSRKVLLVGGQGRLELWVQSQSSGRIHSVLLCENKRLLIFETV